MVGAGSGGNCDSVDVLADKQIVKVVDLRRARGIGACLTTAGIVVPDGDKLSVRVLVYPRGVLGCMHMPVSENRYRDRLGHEQSFPERRTGVAPAPAAQP